MAEIGNNIQKAKSLLDRGELVGLPTETVYGLAGNALNTEAVSKIFEVKNRPYFDPLILHTHSIDAIKLYTENIPEEAIELAHKFWPGPLTILLKRNNKVPDLTCSGLDRAAFRIPNHPVALELLQNLDYPLAAPSANPFGYISPTSAVHVQNQLGDKIQYILNGEVSNVGIESTIVGFDKDQPVVYRLGGLDVNEIESIIGKVKVMEHSSSQPDAPGMLKSHYAPRKKIILGNIEELLIQCKGLNIGVLSFHKEYSEADLSYILSEKQDMHEAAKNLFSYLRLLDESSVDIILTELVPNTGLGKAINDRLKRASI
ncbi:threonylcarbamoyl-AMP synthase [Marivirga sp. S37H4]|uniref:Threonylcarbamoyl-AMP synthase n=1 Tax=Marivirga aurantiaca TaxID=2802615 RepID=A0A935C5L6_9BACT|nr:L-threonylcarbamoyladenylate synthase [Marivirga aurantiaca]MBK6263875.1 threonylcarbamoyl-AMP synthase [Marivirga aurantiaca]